MSKFNVGDTVRRIVKNFDAEMQVGTTHIVSSVQQTTITVKGHDWELSKEYFELVKSAGNKFKVGDTVQRIRKDHPRGLHKVGSTHVVTAVDLQGLHFDNSGTNNGYAEYYQVYQSPYLTPQDAFTRLINGEPTQACHNGEWLDINELDNVSVNFLLDVKCRVKPKTIFINGIEVVAPATRDEIKGCDVNVYVIRQGVSQVVPVTPREALTGGCYAWLTREDAYKAYKAICSALEGDK